MEDYCVVDDIDFSCNKDKFYISSDTVAVYLKVNEKIYNLLQIIVSDIKDNKYSQWSNESDKTALVNYRKGFEFLKKYNLIYLRNEGIQKKNALETEIMGRKIKVFSFSEYEKSSILQLLLLSLLIISSVFLVINIYSIFETNSLGILVNGYQSYDMLSVSSIISIIFAIFISLFIHELFHIMFANLFNVTVRSISFYLFLGFQPVMFVKYRGLLKVNKARKLLIYCAGFIGNILAANISFFLFEMYNKSIFGVVVIVNLCIILDNISIINNTDFYYIVTELFNKTNFKVNMIRSLGEVLNKKITVRDYFINKKNIYQNIYLLIGSIYRIVIIFTFMYFILSSIITNEYRVVISILLVIIYMYINIKKVIKDVKVSAMM